MRQQTPTNTKRAPWYELSPNRLTMSRLKRCLCLVVFLCIGVVLAGCASQPAVETSDPPGFFLGLLHGFCLLFSLIASVFMDVRIYAYPNAGFLYDLGFFFGAAAFLGAGGAGANKAGESRQ